MTNILPLHKATPEVLSLVGEKAINCHILNQKFPVPPCFIITAAAFKNFLEENSLDKKIKQLIDHLNPSNIVQLEQTEITIKNLILASKIPEGLQEEIIDAYYSLNISADTSLSSLIQHGEDSLVILRPSLIGYAQKNTHQALLGIQGKENFITAVLECFSSFYHPEILKMQKQRECHFAIIVQQMIDSQASGVFYTSYKMNAEEVLILASKGLGIALQTDLLIPDRYFITKKTLSTAAMEYGKQHFFFERDFETNKITKEYMHDEYAKRQKISAAVIGELALMSNTIETLFEKPQAVDFAVYKEKIWLLGTKEAEWYQEKKENEIKEKQRQENLIKIPEIKEEEIQKKEEEISIFLSKELEEDAFVVRALASKETSMPQVNEQMHSLILSSNQEVNQDPNNINTIILGMDFQSALQEVIQNTQSTNNQEQLQQELESKKTSSVYSSSSFMFEQEKIEKQSMTEKITPETELEEKINDNLSAKKEMNVLEKAAGEIVIHCFHQIKETVPKEHWPAIPELRHLAVLVQNFSQKKIPPNSAQVKFALDAVEKIISALRGN